MMGDKFERAKTLLARRKDREKENEELKAKVNELSLEATRLRSEAVSAQLQLDRLSEALRKLHDEYVAADNEMIELYKLLRYVQAEGDEAVVLDQLRAAAIEIEHRRQTSITRSVVSA